MKSFFRLLPLVVTAGLVAPQASAQTPAQTPAPPPVQELLNVGDAAPDFTLEGTDGKTYSLSKNLKGRWLVLAWFPKAYTGG